MYLYEDLGKQRDPRDGQAQRKDHVRNQKEDGHLQAKERGLRETTVDDTLILDFWLLEL